MLSFDLNNYQLIKVYDNLHKKEFNYNLYQKIDPKIISANEFVIIRRRIDYTISVKKEDISLKIIKGEELKSYSIDNDHYKVYVYENIYSCGDDLSKVLSDSIDYYNQNNVFYYILGNKVTLKYFNKYYLEHKKEKIFYY